MCTERTQGGGGGNYGESLHFRGVSALNLRKVCIDSSICYSEIE